MSIKTSDLIITRYSKGELTDQTCEELAANPYKDEPITAPQCKVLRNILSRGIDPHEKQWMQNQRFSETFINEISGPYGVRAARAQQQWRISEIYKFITPVYELYQHIAKERTHATPSHIDDLFKQFNTLKERVGSFKDHLQHLGEITPDRAYAASILVHLYKAIRSVAHDGHEAWVLEPIAESLGALGIDSPEVMDVIASYSLNYNSRIGTIILGQIGSVKGINVLRQLYVAHSDLNSILDALHLIIQKNSMTSDLGGNPISHHVSGAAKRAAFKPASDLLLEILNTHDERSIQVRAAKELWSIGTHRTRALEVYKNVLESNESEHFMKIVIRILGETRCSAAVAPLTTLLVKRKSSDLNLEITSALTKIGVEAYEATPILDLTLQDKQWPKVAEQAAAALGKIGTADAVQKLANAALNSPIDKNVRLAAIRAIKDIRTEEAAKQLSDLATRNTLESDIRFTALQSLRDMQTTSGSRRLREIALNESAPKDVRLKTLEMLGDSGRDDDVATLSSIIRMRGVEDPDILTQAARQLRRIALDPSKPGSSKAKTECTSMTYDHQLGPAIREIVDLSL